MNIHNSAQVFYRPIPNARFRQQIRRQKAFSWAGDRMLWLSIGKMLLVLCPLVLLANLWLAASFNTLDASVKQVEQAREELMDKQIKLLKNFLSVFRIKIRLNYFNEGLPWPGNHVCDHRRAEGVDWFWSYSSYFLPFPATGFSCTKASGRVIFTRYSGRVGKHPMLTQSTGG